MLFKQMSGSWKTGLKIEKGNTRLKFTVIITLFSLPALDSHPRDHLPQE